MGVSTLYELAVRGVEATLLEAREDLALETSFANGAMQTPSMSDPWNGPGVGGHLLGSLFNPGSAMKLRLRAAPDLALWGIQFLRHSTPLRHQMATQANFKLALYSTQATARLTQALSLAYDSAEAGAMKVFASEAAMAPAQALAQTLIPHGLRLEVLNPSQAAEREPQLAAVHDKIAGALYSSQDRVGDARAFTLALAEQAKALGARVETGVKARRLLHHSGRIIGVATDAGERRGDVVLAAGVSAPRLAGAHLHLPIKPAKGYSLTLDARPLGGDMPAIPVIDDAMHAAIVPLGARLRLVGTAEFAGFDARLRPERIDNLFALFARLYPKLAHRIDRRTQMPWAGLRPMSADGRPFIGAAPIAGLWLNCGHGHLGWTNAVGAARLLADLMQDKRPEIDPAPFAYAGRNAAARLTE